MAEGWIAVVMITGSLLAASVHLLRKAARRWWEYLAVVALTAALVPLVYRTAGGDVSAWLPYGIWSDGFDGKDQIIIASAASSILIPLVLASGAVLAIKRAGAYARVHTNR